MRTWKFLGTFYTLISKALRDMHKILYCQWSDRETKYVVDVQYLDALNGLEYHISFRYSVVP